MLLHYLKIAWRNLLKYKTQTIISIVGLTVGVVFFAYGYHWYTYETTYDSFYPDSDRIYRVYGIEESTQRKNLGIPYAAVEKLQQDFPEIERIAVVYSRVSLSLTYDNERIHDSGYDYVDENFFKMFPPRVICGSLEGNLFNEKESSDMVVTEGFARRLFKTPENALGKELVSSSNEKAYTIKAVIQDPPPNSIFQAAYYLADSHTRSLAAESEEKTQWASFHHAQLYTRLHKHVNEKAFGEKLRDYAVNNNYNTDLLFGICPLRRVKHDLKDTGNVFSKQPGYDLAYIRAFLLAGILLLFSAFFNWFNILVNGVVQRTREMNLRKVTGASTPNLFRQLFVEAGVVMFIVVLLSFCVVELTASTFERWFYTVMLRQPLNKIVLVTVVSITVFLYLVLFVSFLRFLQKTSFRKNVSRFQLHRALSAGKISLVLQLIVGAFFIMSAYVFWQQVRFMRTADWGIKTDHIIQVGIMGFSKMAILDEIKQLSTVEEISPTGLFTISNEAGPFSQSNVTWEGRPGDFSPYFQVVDIGHNFVSFFSLEVVEGRDLTEADFSSDVGKALVNEEAIRMMRLENPVGEKIEIDADYYTPEGPGRSVLEIVGVVKDFHGIGLKKAIMPMILKSVSPWRETIYYARVVPGTERETLHLIEAILKKHFEAENPTWVSDLMLITMNDLLNDLSKSEQELSRLFTVVAVLCILIAVFGIYSVSQRETQRRRKEIAIRKTAGATTKEVMALFFREYFGIALIACAVALPIAGFFMHRWLETFAYRVNISWWMFVLVILVVGLVVFLTIVSQVTRAAGQNPAEVVKSE